MGDTTILTNPMSFFWLGDEQSFFSFQAKMLRIQDQKLMDLIAPPAHLRDSYGDEDEERPEFDYMTDLVDGVGIIYIQGDLTSEAKWYNRYYGLISYDEIRNAKIELVERGARSILNVYRTPGGSASGISSAAELDNELKSQGIKTYSYNDSMMMSGGYWLGASGEKVFTEKMAFSGSIGVITIHMSQKDFLDKLGITATVMRKGEFKALGTPYEKLSEKARDEIEGRMDGIYELFLDHVGSVRNLSRQHLLDSAAEGRVFMGAKAVEVGLADGVLTYDKTLQYVIERSQSPVQVPGSALSSNQFIQGDDMKIRVLNKAGQAAVASGGISEADALKDPKLSEETEQETAAATDPKADEAKADAAADEQQAKDTAAAPAAAVDTSLLDKLTDLSGRLAVAEKETKDLKEQLAAANTDRQGLRRIAILAVQRMNIALSSEAGDLTTHADGALVDLFDRTNARFENRFPGSARARAASDTDQNTQQQPVQAQVGDVSLTTIGGKKR